jgi:hypothetical protein
VIGRLPYDPRLARSVVRPDGEAISPSDALREHLPVIEEILADLTRRIG